MMCFYVIVPESKEKEAQIIAMYSEKQNVLTLSDLTLIKQTWTRGAKNKYTGWAIWPTPVGSCQKNTLCQIGFSDNSSSDQQDLNARECKQKFLFKWWLILLWKKYKLIWPTNLRSTAHLSIAASRVPRRPCSVIVNKVFSIYHCNSLFVWFVHLRFQFLKLQLTPECWLLYGSSPSWSTGDKTG